MTDLAIPDVNVLVALTNPAHEFHREAHRWLAGTSRYATTPITESGLLRMLLNPVVTGQPVSTRLALTILAGVRTDRRAEFLPDDTSLTDAAVDTTGLTGHRQVTDWHLTNLAARHDAVLVTFDRRLAAAMVPADAARVHALG
ncbi:ribonuclease VapC [Marmoricola endophyticus]|uniref:Ribonuclease VapC n=1 Tax=Marmoricola endophyticus TaxID=2040280 RepID=A0A917F1U8_9ACTN|nr:TA system VapC family ribonuclease toxin [Marmoricola endophyticus]GGF34562.1 ribonuclease VapC [Marmoricola endophyticus]